MDDINISASVGTGIKGRGFGGSNSNGANHRKNAARKRAHYNTNQATRSTLYREFQKRTNPPLTEVARWHATLNALSAGKV